MGISYTKYFFSIWGSEATKDTDVPGFQCCAYVGFNTTECKEHSLVGLGFFSDAIVPSANVGNFF